jgi:hypothetical protein
MPQVREAEKEANPMESVWNPYGTPMESVWNMVRAIPEHRASKTPAASQPQDSERGAPGRARGVSAYCAGCVLGASVASGGGVWPISLLAQAMKYFMFDQSS